jgi:enoyl-CoA hydratase/carnithine racemase
VGGGGSVRIPKLIGAARMTDMMLTGRVYNAQDGERAGFAQYLVPEGQASTRRWSWPNASPKRPADQLRPDARPAPHRRATADQGFLTEALMAAIAQSAPEAKDRVRAFLAGRAAKVKKS